MKVALFDFDGTLYPYETFNVLIKKLKNHPDYRKNYKQFMRKFIGIYIAYKLKIVSKLSMQNKAMELYMASFKGLNQNEIERFFKQVADDMSGDLRGSLMDRVRMLKEKNYYTMLISGAYVPLLNALFENTLFDHIVGTEVHYSSGVYHPKTALTRVHADRKIEVIKTHFKNNEVDWQSSLAFSDSYSDVKMLQMVGHPVAVVPDSQLLSVARENNWEIYQDSQ